MHNKPETYDQYLESEWWRNLRGQALARDKYRCVVCNSAKRLNGHHRYYRGRYCEKLEDVYTLCRLCHKRFHDHNKLPKDKPIANKPQKKRKRPKNRHGGHARIKSDAEVSMADTMLRNLQTAKEAARRQMRQADQAMNNAMAGDGE